MNRFRAGVATLIGGTEVPVRRILGRNPGPMTGPGTNSYLLGWQRLCLIDPGPDDDTQLASFLTAIGSATLKYILVTHTHRDHSPGARRLQEATGAELVGMVAPEGPAQDAGFRPAREWVHGTVIGCGEYSLRLIHTPGHVSNHLCYLLEEEGLLFTGDHVLQGTTPVILPPDGDMGDYLDSLALLQGMDLRLLAPGHGDIMTQPQEELAGLVAHRLRRERKVIRGLEQLGRCTLEELLVPVYDDVAEHLLPWAKKTLTAHLLKLQRDGRVDRAGDFWQCR